MSAEAYIFAGKVDKNIPVGNEITSFRKKFLRSERKKLTADHALIYTSHGKSLISQMNYWSNKGQRLLSQSSFNHELDIDLVFTAPSEKMEIAIYPQTTRAFVPGCFGRPLEEQQKIVAADAAGIKQKLGLENISEIIPKKVSTVTDIVSQHFKAKGECLVGDNYANENNFYHIYITTDNPANSSGWQVAVGNGNPPKSILSLHKLGRNIAHYETGVLRMVVPIIDDRQKTLNSW